MDLMSFDAAVKNAAKQLTGKGKTIVCIAATKSTKGGHEFSVVVNGNITQIACCLMAVMTRHQHFAEAIKMAADGYKMVINLKQALPW